MKENKLLKTALTAILAVLTFSIQAQTEKQWWGMWTSPMGLAETGELAQGDNVMGIRLTTQNKKVVGAMLHGIRFYISDKTSVQHAKVWASSRQNAGFNLLNIDIPLDDLRDMKHDGEPTVVMLDEPIDLLQNNPYSNMYLGFDITMPAEGTMTPCQMLASGKSIGQQYANLYGWSSVEESCGPLAFQLLISNPDLPETMVTPSIDEGIIVLKEQQLTADIAFLTEGMNGLQSIDFTFGFNGSEQDERHYDFNPHIEEIDAAPRVPVAYTSPSVSGYHDMMVRITKVNGTEVESEAVSQPILVLDQTAQKRTVMEEFTGTWCPNCVRGIVGLELLQEIFGDRFIGISVHNDDPMTIADYDKSAFRKGVTGAMGGFPSATVDRSYMCDPYMGYTLQMHFQTDAIVEEALKMKPVADLEVTAAWVDDTHHALQCDVATTFYFNSEDTHYALVLVATADGLTGEDGKWLQVNKYSGESGLDADMDEFVNGPKRMQLSYNDVAVAVAGVENGISGSIQTPLVSQQAQHFVQQLAIPASLVQGDAQYYAVAMLVDTETGRVENAAKSAPITIPTGISTPSIQQKTLEGTAACTPTPIYDLQGRCIGNLSPLTSHPLPLKKGIYIMDGKKVVITR